ncbi:PEP-CTERM sorting domain-containing protein [Massilia rubra]|nr:PEP-CTERM sorting domain-containing protein [Massilia rubra]
MFTYARRIAVTAIACAAVLAPQAAFAQVHIEAGGLTFDSFYSPRGEYLVSDVDGAATFSLVNAVDRMSYPNMTTYFQDYGSIFQLSAREGYRVTGYSVSGGFYGTHYVGHSPDGSGEPGSADSGAAAWAYASDTPGGARFASGSHSASNLNGHSDFRIDSGALDKTGSFYFSFDGYSSGSSSPATWYEPGQWWPSRAYSAAEIGLKNPLLLTVYTQAVPEPHTYAMTLAGLALLAGVARRRTRAGQKKREA